MMKMTIDTETNTMELEIEGQTRSIDLYSKEAFEAISRQWIRVGWNQKYQYTFSWLGRPIIQLPEDIVRIQEVIFSVKPDVVIETGVAHGGSLILYASLLKAMGKGRVVGVDIEIRPHNRAALESHFLYDRITLIEGSSIAPDIVNKVKSLVNKDETALVILDSNHTYEHVFEELKAYSDLIPIGSYIVATDGIMYDLYDVPRGKEDWKSNNPMQAAMDFVKTNHNFIVEQPEWPFNESELNMNLTHWPGAWLKRIA